MYDLLAPFISKILEEIVDKGRNMVDMQKFNDLCDLFFYLPDKARPNQRNESESMWFILSSNVYGGHTSGDVKD